MPPAAGDVDFPAIRSHMCTHISRTTFLSPCSSTRAALLIFSGTGGRGRDIPDLLSYALLIEMGSETS
uniref:Uncharacterized protein n=1 Tax=Setaria italica TaxID=4555 RepID=K3Y470_SETIT